MKDGEAAVDVTGALSVDQSEFGIAPFAVFGGAIAVQDRVNIKFKVRATPIK